ncbi:trypsin-like serine peptidase [Dongshaea marina]|uniref:trypsin-like serine peptidase n=1 Tax=Dongshaea marina TaxID=2047966 RepID=UPI000D3E2DB3|nr:trypsin-like serine protease [Dongshaea marina]
MNLSVLMSTLRVTLAASAIGLIFSVQASQAAKRDQLPESYPESRYAIDASMKPWRSIGEINVAGQRRCSGVLIHQSLVLTAAHCLWNPWKNRFYPATEIHFVAGAQLDTHLAHSRGKKLVGSKDYHFKEHPPFRELVHDWALLELAKPLGRWIGYIPLSTAPLKNGSDNLLLAGYRQDRPYVLSLSKRCSLIKNRGNALLEHNCHAFEGDSGGPLIQVHEFPGEPSQFRVVGVQVAQVEIRSPKQLRVVSIAVANTLISPFALQFIQDIQQTELNSSPAES